MPRILVTRFGKPFKQSITEWLPHYSIIHDKFHIVVDANAAVNEIRSPEFFPKGALAQELVKG